MINAINWHTIILLATENNEEEKLYRDFYPVVCSLCTDLNTLNENYCKERAQSLYMVENYVKAKFVDKAGMETETFPCINNTKDGPLKIVDYNNFLEKLENFRDFVESTYSSDCNIGEYIVNIEKARSKLFDGNGIIKKNNEIFAGPITDVRSYFAYLRSNIVIENIQSIAPSFPILDEKIKRKLFLNLVHMVSDYLCKKEMHQFFNQLFELSSKRDHCISEESMNEIISIESEDFFMMEDMTVESMDYLSLEAAEMEVDSSEDVMEDKNNNAFLKFFDKVKNRLKAIPSQLSMFKKKADMFFSKRKNIRLYKRVLGKIPGLYNRYGSNTQIDENVMKGDPVEILTTQASEYVINLGKSTGEVSDKLMILMNKINTASNVDAIKSALDEWVEASPLKTKDGEDSSKVDGLAKRMRKATRARLVAALLNGNEIYGFTKESMVLKKLPPPNHTIVSLFVENPFEKPQQQAVTDIFKSPKSFEIMANSDKNKIFAVSDLSAAVLKNKINTETFDLIDKKRKDALKRMKKGQGFVDRENEEDDLSKENKKMIKAALKGIKLSIKEVSQMKIYVMDCINVYFSMMMRIDNLCLACINAMLVTEKEASDGKYNLGEGKALKGKTNSHYSEAGRVKKKADKREATYDYNYGDGEEEEY